MNDFSFIQTKPDLNAFLEAIENYKNSLYKQDQIPPKNFFTNDQIKIVQNYPDLNNLISDLNKIPSLTLQLAFHPTAKQISDLANWFWESFKKVVILDIQVDFSLIGGVVIGSNGKVWNYSLSSKINT